MNEALSPYDVTPPHRTKIVTYDPGHQQEFAGLVTSVHQEFGFPFDPVLDQDLEQTEAIYRNIWVLLEADHVVESAALQDNGHDAILKRMYLAPRLRGMGYGHKLLTTAINEAKLANYHRLLLDTNRRQVAARRLYVANGFKLVRKNGNVLFYELDLNSVSQ